MSSTSVDTNAGFNQSGGAYYLCLMPLEGAGVVNTNPAGGPYINVLSAGPSGSGGNFVGPTFQLASMSSITGINSGYASTLVTTGALLKDMGKTVVSSNRVFRKFAPVVNQGALAAANHTFGVIGSAPTGTNPNTGYGSFYLEVGREGTGAPAPIVRYV